ncbi:mucin-15-like [Brachionichthys hirsutus]|uniref:mucin-15-like n=1 Tax=Brachionichthys hirsutus TaxID=412623 RepID=UPI00360455D9
MKIYVQITVGLLLLVQACHSASIPFPTDSPGRAIDKSYFRGPAKSKAGSENAAGAETGYDQVADKAALESSNERSDGAVFDPMSVNPADQDRDANETAVDLTFATPSVAPIIPTGTTKQEFPNTTVSQTTAQVNPTNSSQVNAIDTEEESNNSMTTPSEDNSQNTTSFVNDTDLHTSTLAHEDNITQVFTTAPGVDVWSRDLPDTGSTNATTGISESPSTTVISFETTETVANTSDDDSLKGSSSGIGLESDSSRKTNNRAWGAILGIVVAVACVGTVVYILLKEQHKKGFSHRKLVEEHHSDSVHRLDNGEPLDFSLGGSTYYNPGLQGDNIQMSNLPQRH